MAIKLGTMLVQAGLISLGQLDEALKNQVIFGGKLGTNLIEMGLVGEEDIARLLSEKLRVPSIGSEQLIDVPKEITGLISKETAARYRAIPIGLERKRLSLAMQDPSDLLAVDELAFVTDYAIKPLVAPEVSLVLALEKHYGIRRDTRYIPVIRQIENRKRAVRAKKPKNERDATIYPADSDLWRESVAHFSIDALSSSLAEVRDRDEIAQLILDYISADFRHSGLFLVRDGHIMGWRAVARGHLRQDFAHLSLSADEPSTLAGVVESRNFYMGAPGTQPADKKILTALGDPAPETVLFVPLVKRERVVCTLYVSGSASILSGYFFELQKVLQKTSLAFDMLILRNKILMT